LGSKVRDQKEQLKASQNKGTVDDRTSRYYVVDVNSLNIPNKYSRSEEITKEVRAYINYALELTGAKVTHTVFSLADLQNELTPMDLISFIPGARGTSCLGRLINERFDE